MPLLTVTQERAYQKGLACAERVEQTLSFLEQLAQVYPPLIPTVAELRTRQQYLRALCETAVTLNDQSKTE